MPPLTKIDVTRFLAGRKAVGLRHGSDRDHLQMPWPRLRGKTAPPPEKKRRSTIWPDACISKNPCR
jgi:hypothetical protein